MLTHIYSLIGLFEGFCSLERCYKDAYTYASLTTTPAMFAGMSRFVYSTMLRWTVCLFLKHYSITSYLFYLKTYCYGNEVLILFRKQVAKI